MFIRVACLAVTLLLPAGLLSAGRAHADTLSWTGGWDTRWRDGGARMELTQRGREVVGTYPSYGGKVEGQVNGRELRGHWTEGQRTGGITFILSGDGNSFMGRFDNGQWWTGGRASAIAGAEPDGMDQTGAREVLRSFVVAGNNARADAPDQLAMAAAAIDFGPSGMAMAPGEKIAAAQALFDLMDLTTFKLWAIPGKRAQGPTLPVTLHQAGGDAALPLVLTQDASRRWFIAMPDPATMDAARKALLARFGDRPPAPQDFLRRGNARDTMRSFAASFDDWEGAGRAQAFAALDLSDFSTATRDHEGELVAQYLNGILDRVGTVVPQEIPDDPGSRVPYLVFSHPAGRVEIAPASTIQTPGIQTWQFTAETVRSARALYAAVEDMPEVGSQSLPDPPSTYFALRGWVRDHAKPLFARAGELEAWQAIGLALALFAATLAAVLLAGAARLLFRFGLGAKLAGPERRFGRPLRLGLTFALFRWATSALGLPERMDRITLGIGAVLLAVAVVWGGWKLIDSLGGLALRRAEGSVSAMDGIGVSLVLVLCKILLLVGGFAFIANQLSLPYDSVLAGLGIGGLAVAFASKETLSNVFGAAILVADRPFRRGDFIVASDVKGTVEHVGIRSTRVRTAEDSIIVVPNGKLADAMVNNLGTRRTRLASSAMLVNYATGTAQIEAFMAELVEMVGKIPTTVPGSVQVGVSGIEPDGIGVKLSCHFNVQSSAQERECNNALVLGILRVADRLDVRLGDRAVLVPEALRALERV